ncbi:MAG: hypothetical protein O3B47_02515 [bacterium]|nr:hypothetical protein [bacterium]
MQCKSKYTGKSVNLIATTKTEGLFEMKCPKCECSTIVTVLLSTDLKIQDHNSRTHLGISQNDVLDMKNFLGKFDGNFKRIFTKEK